MHVEETRVDAPDAAELLTEYFRERADGFPGGGYRIALPDPTTFVRPVGVFLIARDDDGSPLGCGGIRDIGVDGDGRSRYEVKHLYVRPVARGRGAGRLLLDTVESEARSLGADLLVLDTNSSLREAAGLYATRGYSPIPPYNENPNADTWLAKPLGPSRA